MTSATNLYAIGRGYLHSAQIVSQHTRFAQGGYLSAPVYMLIGFVLELMMKALLVQSGAAEKEIKSIGHDLGAALAKANSFGLAVPALIVELIGKMQGVHKGHTFRYMTDFGTIDLPNIEQSLAALVTWDDEVRLQLGLPASG